MAAAAITLSDNVATLESDSTGAVISNGTTETNSETAAKPRVRGELRNHGPSDVYCFISQDERDAALTSDVVTTGAQAQQQVPLPAGASIPIYKDFKTIAHKTAAGTATLSFIPAR